MAATNKGVVSVSSNRDEEGYSTYDATFKVAVDPGDGAQVARDCPGLPVPGSFWQGIPGITNDSDDWVWCRWTDDVTAHGQTEHEPIQFFLVKKVFSNKPPPWKQQRCNDTPIKDPLLEPQKISGSFTKYTEEAAFDRFGLPIFNSAGEFLKGPKVEFDSNRTTVIIEQNVAALDLELMVGMKNTVNNSSIWGAPPRCVKLGNISWERRFYGQCFAYYMRRFEFEVNIKQDPATGAYYSGFDRLLDDEGTRVLNGHWDAKPAGTPGSGDWILDKIGGVFYPDRRNPSHFIQYKDKEGRPGKTRLNGAGVPAGVVVRAGLNLWMSLVPNAGLPDAHYNNDLGDSTPVNLRAAPVIQGPRWVQLATDPLSPPIWRAGDFWTFGALVNYRNAAGILSKYINTNKLGTRLEPAKTLLVDDWFPVATVTNKTKGTPPDYGASVGPSYDPTGVTVYASGDFVSAQTDVGPYFLSLVPATAHAPYDLDMGKVATQVGIKGGTDAKNNPNDPWVLIANGSSPTSPPEWQQNRIYPFGSIVTRKDPVDGVGRIFVQLNLRGNRLAQPRQNVDWVQVPALNDKGSYDPTGLAVYGAGDYVSPPKTFFGKVLVQKYDESDFTLLRIPLVLV